MTALTHPVALESRMPSRSHRGFSQADIESVGRGLKSWPFAELHKIAEEVAAYVPPPRFDLSSIPTMQQIALINCTESQIRRTLANRMIAQAGAKPTWQDYARLVERNILWRRPRDGFHNLTPEGRSIAAMMLPLLCLRYDCHLTQLSSQDRWQNFYRCDCGFLGSVRRSTTADGNIAALHSAYAEFHSRELKAEAV